MKRFTDFYEAFHFLRTHKMVENIGVDGFKNSHFNECLCVDVVKVNPETNAIEINDNLNTKTQVWLEFGPIHYNNIFDEIMPEHDTDLDCGADTYEDAIIKLANLVDLYYDDNGEKAVLPAIKIENKHYKLIDPNTNETTNYTLTETFVYDDLGRELGVEYTVLDTANNIVHKESEKAIILNNIPYFQYKLIEIKN